MTRFAFLHRACKTQLAIMAQMKCAMHFGLHSCFCKHWTSLQRWPVCSQIPKSISIISVCSHLSLCYVLSNIKCGQGKYCLVFMLVFIVVALVFGFRKPHNGTLWMNHMHNQMCPTIHISVRLIYLPVESSNHIKYVDNSKYAASTLTCVQLYLLGRLR